MEDVFAYLADVSTHVDWQSQRALRRPADAAADRRRIAVPGGQADLGRRYESVVEVVACEPPGRIACRVVDGPVPYQMEYSLTENGDDSTRVEMAVMAETGTYFGVAEPILQSIAEREIAGALGNLKDILESRVDSAG